MFNLLRELLRAQAWPGNHHISATSNSCSRKSASTVSIRTSSASSGASTNPSASRTRARLLQFGANNYLSLSEHPRVRAAAIRAITDYGIGPGGSRVMSGTVSVIEEVERRIAALTGMEDCLTFPTGYMANVTVFQTVMNPLVGTASLPHLRGSHLRRRIRPRLDTRRLHSLGSARLQVQAQRHRRPEAPARGARAASPTSSSSPRASTASRARSSTCPLTSRWRASMARSS